MIVKVRDLVINTEDEMALIVLTSEEKQQIADMGPIEDGNKHYYCSAPTGTSEESMIEFMSMSDTWPENNAADYNS